MIKLTEMMTEEELKLFNDVLVECENDPAENPIPVTGPIVE